MMMPARKFSASDSYRYGFNGKEQDHETTGTTTYDYGFRIYNPALGKFLSVDPLTNKFPFYTPYQFAGNMPIWAVDLDGAEPLGYSDKAQFKRNGFAWLYKSDEEKIINQIDGSRIYRFEVIAVGGEPYTVFRKETDYIGVANRLSTRYEYFYLDNDFNNPMAFGQYQVRDKNGCVETKGALIPFETREQTDARIGKESTNLILAALGVAAVLPFATPTLTAASITQRGVSVGVDYTSQVVGNFIAGKSGIDAFSNINATALILAGINPSSSWKALVSNNALGSVASYSMTSGYTGIGGGKDISTAVLETVVGTFAGRATRNIDIRAQSLGARLQHVERVLGSSTLSQSLQRKILGNQLIGIGTGVAAGSMAEALSNTLETNE